jgi:hypothetical protein
MVGGTMPMSFAFQSKTMESISVSSRAVVLRRRTTRPSPRRTSFGGSVGSAAWGVTLSSALSCTVGTVVVTPSVFATAMVPLSSLRVCYPLALVSLPVEDVPVPPLVI